MNQRKEVSGMMYKSLLRYSINEKEIKEWDEVLKTLDTFGNCQRPVFSLTYFSIGVTHHMHKITNLGKFKLN